MPQIFPAIKPEKSHAYGSEKRSPLIGAFGELEQSHGRKRGKKGDGGESFEGEVCEHKGDADSDGELCAGLRMGPM